MREFVSLLMINVGIFGAGQRMTEPLLGTTGWNCLMLIIYGSSWEERVAVASAILMRSLFFRELQISCSISTDRLPHRLVHARYHHKSSKFDRHMTDAK